MKIWPFDPLRRGDRAASYISGPRRSSAPWSRSARSARRSATDGHHGRVPLAVEPARRDADRPGAGEFEPFWYEDPIKMEQLDDLGRYRGLHPRPVCAQRDARHPLVLPRAARAPARPASSCSTSPGAAASPKPRRSPPWPRPTSCPVAPHDCTGPVVLAASTHLSLNAPNALIQEIVRAFYTGWYSELVTELPRVEKGFAIPRPPRDWAWSCCPTSRSARVRSSSAHRSRSEGLEK